MEGSLCSPFKFIFSMSKNCLPLLKWLKSILKDQPIKIKLKDNFLIKEVSSFNVLHDKSIIFIDGEKNINNFISYDLFSCIC